MSESVLQEDDEIIDNIGFEENSINEEEMTGNDVTNEENLHNVRERVRNQEDDWIVAGREKRRKMEKINISISSKEMLPKKFALARLLDSAKILGIQSVKYVNAYKVLVRFDDQINAEKLITCQSFIEKEWRIQKTWEVNTSYGIIRDIEIDLSDSELLECIRKCNDLEIISVKRLNRRTY